MSTPPDKLVEKETREISTKDSAEEPKKITSDPTKNRSQDELKVMGESSAINPAIK
jgi:hypothetical protein